MPTIRANVEAQLVKELAPYSIDVRALLIENISFDAVFEDAITQKQVAQQNALRERELVEAEKAKADQKIEAARGEGERLRVEALGQADANRLLAESLTEPLIRFQALQKLSDNIQIALIPSGQGLIIDPTTLLQGLSGGD
jgi:regulator of protease activity HflC (stomatin/prohibitin superfamily)